MYLNLRSVTPPQDSSAELSPARILGYDIVDEADLNLASERWQAI